MELHSLDPKNRQGILENTSETGVSESHTVLLGYHPDAALFETYCPLCRARCTLLCLGTFSNADAILNEPFIQRWHLIPVSSLNSQEYARWLSINSVIGIVILAAIAAEAPFSLPLCLFWGVASYVLLAFAIVPRMRAADWLSASRVLLSSLAVICVELGAATWPSPVLFALAIATDWVDGYLARRTGATWHGARLDMEADQLLVLLLAVAVMEHTALGVLALMLPGFKYLFTLLTRAVRVPVGEVKPVRGDNRRARLIFIFVVAALFMNLPSLPVYLSVKLPMPQGQATDAILFVAVVLLCISFSSDWLYQWRNRWT